MELIQLSFEDIASQEETNDPCEGCTNKTCEWGICSHANE